MDGIFHECRFHGSSRRCHRSSGPVDRASCGLPRAGSRSEFKHITLQVCDQMKSYAKHFHPHQTPYVKLLQLFRTITSLFHLLQNLIPRPPARTECILYQRAFIWKEKKSRIYQLHKSVLSSRWPHCLPVSSSCTFSSQSCTGFGLRRGSSRTYREDATAEIVS